MIRFDSLQQIMILLFIFICKRDNPEGLKLTVHAINSQVTSDKLLQDSPFNFPLCVCQSKRELEIASGDT